MEHLRKAGLHSSEAGRAHASGRDLGGSETRAGPSGEEALSPSPSVHRGRSTPIPCPGPGPSPLSCREGCLSTALLCPVLEISLTGNRLEGAACSWRQPATNDWLTGEAAVSPCPRVGCHVGSPAPQGPAEAGARLGSHLRAAPPPALLPALPSASARGLHEDPSQVCAQEPRANAASGRPCGHVSFKTGSGSTACGARER